MRNFIINICIFGILTPFIFLAYALVWVLGLGLLEIFFFWNESISHKLEDIRLDYSLFNLFDIIPYLIHFFIGWWIFGFIGFFVFRNKRHGVTDNFTNIDGDLE